MRIVIATGIYPPDIGGPALYAEGVKTSFEGGGHSAPVVLFGTLKAYPTGVRHVLYTCKLLFVARKADAIIAFDTYSVGVPATLVGLLLRIPVVIRIGGDFVWERYVERTEKLLPLPHFYQKLPPLGVSGRIAFSLVRWMLSHAELAFNTQWLRDIWQPVYGFSPERAHVVDNAIGERIIGKKSDRTLLLYGRSLVLKNASAFRRAFARARKRGLDLTLEERAVSHHKLIERIQHAHATVVPSISDVAPNTIVDGLRCGKPFLLSKYSGYAERFKEYGIIVDPLDEEDMARGMEALSDKKTYAALCTKIQTFTDVRTYADVANDFLEILKKIRTRERASENMRVLQIGSDRSKNGSMIAGTPSGQRQELYAQALGQIDDISFTLRSDGFQTRAAEGLVITPTNSVSRLLYGVDAIRIARKLPRPDVVSAQDPFEAGLVGWLVARMKRVPLYVQVHTDFLSPEYARLSLMNRARVLIAGFVLRRADRVRVVSERIRRSIEKKYRLKTSVSVLPIFVDLAHFRNIQPDWELSEKFKRFDKKVLVVSRLEPEKNIALAVRAFAQAAPSSACLIILGRGSGQTALEDLAHDVGLSGRIFFEGERDPAPYYQLADLVLFPSKYDGYGLVIVEALAAGKPVLSTDVGVATEAGALVGPEEKFKGALQEWFTSGPRRAELNGYPYEDFDTYLCAYRDDIVACVDEQMTHV